MSRVRGSLLAALALAVGSLPAGAQEAAPVRLTGVVQDSITGRALPGATVTLTAAHRVTFTDSLGRFSIDLSRPIKDRVRVTQIGFATASFDAVIRPGTRLRIQLTPDPVTLREITARARRNNSHTIEGTVLDSVTGRPVPRAVVWFRSSGGNAVTDTFGHYVYERAKGGSEDIVVDVLGYERRTAYRLISEPWQRLDLALQPDPIVLQGIVVLNERLKHSSVRSGGFRHNLSERDFARSGRRTVYDFFRSSQVYQMPHGRTIRGMQRNRGEVSPVQMACYQTGALNTTATPRYMIGDTLLRAAGILPEGGEETVVFVDGKANDVDSTRADVRPSDFYRAIFVRDFRCGYISYAIVFTKSQLRDAFHRRRGQTVVTPDSLEKLLARVDTLR